MQNHNEWSENNALESAMGGGASLQGDLVQTGKSKSGETGDVYWQDSEAAFLELFGLSQCA